MVSGARRRHDNPGLPTEVGRATEGDGRQRRDVGGADGEAVGAVMRADKQFGGGQQARRFGAPWRVREFGRFVLEDGGIAERHLEGRLWRLPQGLFAEQDVARGQRTVVVYDVAYAAGGEDGGGAGCHHGLRCPSRAQSRDATGRLDGGGGGGGRSRQVHGAVGDEAQPAIAEGDPQGVDAEDIRQHVERLAGGE